MRVLLSEEVSDLGSIGEIVNVKPGFARNYLIPRGKAVLVTKSSQKVVENLTKQLEKKKAEILAQAKELAGRVGKTSVTVAKQVGENEKIFGSVTTAELEELLKAEGLEINRKNITLDQDIKTVGVYSAEVKLHPEVKAKFKVWVVGQ